MQTVLSFEYDHRHEMPEGHDEIRTPDALVEHFVREYTDSGDGVFDPFAGFGTTLRAAERLDRVPYGVEYEPDRVEYVRERLGSAGAVRNADILDFDAADAFPACELAFTSPPFMVEGMERNPFENYAGESTYADYLDDAATAFANVADALAPGGNLVIEVVNVRHDGEVTTLAWDLADSAAESLAFRGEVVVTWDGDGYPDREGSYGYGYDHSYCLEFEKTA